MEREIKFRRAHFKDEAKTQFSHFSYWGVNLEDRHNSTFTSPSFNSKAVYFEDQQLTGLNDSMGVVIYEGDILMYISTNQSSMEVKFKDGCFVGEGPFNTLPLINYFNADDFQLIEVTGNIYEPSLSDHIDKHGGPY